MKLNIGAGSHHIDGFIDIDRKTGGEAFPLKLPDGKAVESNSVDEIRASHVLEHFSHRDIAGVLGEWVRVLKVGGVIKIAVPDLKYICDLYQSGNPNREPIMGYLMGGHLDEDDVHLAAFDEPHLRKLMEDAGLTNISRWESDLRDCAALPVSLNLVGTKSAAPVQTIVPRVPMPEVVAVMSLPRLTFTDCASCLMQAIQGLGLKFVMGQGAFWGNALTNVMQEAISMGAQFILTADYDTLFTPDDVRVIRNLMDRYPDADAICGTQMRREGDAILLTVDETPKNGEKTVQVDRSKFDNDLIQIGSGHFGCTMIRVSSLLKLPKPWFLGVPDPKGEWGEGRVDADIWFWRKWAETGLKLFQANRVALGHLQLVSTWPGPDLKPIHQYLTDYRANGKPAGAWR